MQTMLKFIKEHYTKGCSIFFCPFCNKGHSFETCLYDGNKESPTIEHVFDCGVIVANGKVKLGDVVRMMEEV
jgi:hypothetical protein